MKVVICLCLVLSFSNAMAKARVTAGGDNSGGGYSILNIHGGDSGDLYIVGGDATGGGRSNSGEGGGDTPAHE
jgi:hypothetical protein